MPKIGFISGKHIRINDIAAVLVVIHRPNMKRLMHVGNKMDQDP
jgi:hypothetical protein